MRRFDRLTCSLTLALLALSGCATALPLGAPQAGGTMAAASAPGELIVRFKGQGAARQGLVQRLGMRTVEAIAPLSATVVRVADPSSALAELRKSPEVAWAEPNYVMRLRDGREQADPARAPRLAFAVNDPMLPQQWGMAKIEASGAWDVSMGSRKVTLAIVDTGIYYKHAEFGDRVVNGFDFVNNDYDSRDDMMHGTHCAGIAAAGANDGHGIAGVAPGITLMAVKVMDEEGAGTYANIARGIVYAAQNRADVISLSLGAPQASYALKEAVAYAVKAGVLVVAAMGNENADAPSYPAAYPGVLAVGSTKESDERSAFSNRGDHISVTAPGSRILSTVLYGKYDTVSGTSMAAPFVAGLAALVKSVHPDLTAAQIKARLESTADDLGAPGFDPSFGHGRINARRALAN